MRRSIPLTISALAILLITHATVFAEHQDLKATPGLWKITYRTRIGGEPDPVILKWRCVSEEQMDDPASVFGRPMAGHGSCKKTSYTQASTTISWKYHCMDQSTILDTKGTITFATPLHYTGEITINGVVMGYPIEHVVAVEGDHRAACTSPEE